MKFIVKNMRRLKGIELPPGTKNGDYVELDERVARLSVRRGALQRARLPLKQYQKPVEKTEPKEEKQDVKKETKKPGRKKPSKKPDSIVSAD